jgi:hypothetical protein
LTHTYIGTKLVPSLSFKKLPLGAFVIKRYQLEGRIFEELLELQRLQPRTGLTDERTLIRRRSDNFSKAAKEMVGPKQYHGPFTFKDFEKYLCGASANFLRWDQRRIFEVQSFQDALQRL